MSGNGTPSLFKAHVPRFLWPAVQDHLRRSRATFETGLPNGQRHTLEVYTNFAGAQALEQQGIRTRLVKRGPVWADRERLDPGVGSEAFKAAKPRPRDDPFDVAFRKYADEVLAGIREPL